MLRNLFKKSAVQVAGEEHHPRHAPRGAAATAGYSQKKNTASNQGIYSFALHHCVGLKVGSESATTATTYKLLFFLL